ncbi:MAG: 5-carboxymethyl-2-hydroxymuconate isomerase [Rhizobiales bacterium NRL2]|jgi:2-keto-4-pentenoate hydratase/2-oxohepta-3-ene-1,7-dioic acid hydratase in catechol pathway|nr:MAG: 5-carboxymethyl-2-hydroxymuconate isomerase [Rhizobiales bacterium NRL2]
MRLMSFEIDGKTSFGAVEGDAVIDLFPLLGQKYHSLREVLADDALGKAIQAGSEGKPDHALKDVTFLPVIPDPRKIVCVGLNYEDHRIETGRDPTGYPVLFPRYANCQVGHGQAMVKPRNSDQFDYEGELAVIIGKAGRHIDRDDALKHIAGYACYNDGSVRDWQAHTHQFMPGKNFTATGAFGPWMVTSDEIPDPSRLTLTTRLNGEVMQHANTDQLIFNVPFLISYITSFMELEPGDVIVSGTPGGVGMKRTPPVFMKDGDTVEVEITNVGVLINPIENEG